MGFPLEYACERNERLFQGDPENMQITETQATVQPPSTSLSPFYNGNDVQMASKCKPIGFQTITLSFPI